MPRIDSQMLQIHQRSTQKGSTNGKQISEKEAVLLIQRAHEINTTTSSSFRSGGHRGNKYLMKLMQDHKEDFSKGGRQLIEKYIQTGKMPHQNFKSGPGIGIVEPKGSPTKGGTVVSVKARGGQTSDIGGQIRSGERLGRNGGEAPAHPSDVGGVDRTDRGNRSRRTGGGVPSHPSDLNVGVDRTGSDLRSGGGVPGHPSDSGIGVVRTGSGPRSGRGGSSRPSDVGGIARTGSSHSSGEGMGGMAPANPVGTISSPGMPSGNPSGEVISGMPESQPSGNDPIVSSPVSGDVENPNAPEISSSTSPGAIDNGGATSGPGGVILDFVAQKKTWGCHWFPMQETKAGGDPVNNLYAKDGTLAKLDLVTGKNSQGYEFEHRRKAVNSGKEFAWWGHCNDASQAACTLQMPKHGVVMTAPNGTEVKFTRNDVQGLLVKAVPNLVDKVDFKGERFNTPSRDDINDPKPDVFLQVIQDWAKDGLPFVLDIDRGPQVWNFPYDQAKVTESANAPVGFDPSGLPSDGSVKYYHIDMSGTGFDQKKRTYECYIQRDGNGNAVTSGWIKTPNSDNNPDFMWRPHPKGDLMDKSLWVQGKNSTNPEVDLQTVYDIYIKSLA